MLAKTMLFGMGGVVMGTLHTILRAVSDPIPPNITLGAPYIHLQSDPRVLEILQDLDADFREVDLIAYIRTIQSVDDLVGLRIELSRPNHRPILYDRIQGVVHFRRARASIQRFLSHAEQNRLPRKVIYLQRSVQTLMRHLEEHLRQVMRLTCDIYIHP